MKPEILLDELENLNHDQRIARMVELGKTSLTDLAIKTTLGELEKGDFFQRYLAIQSCFGSQDGNHCLRALTDPSRIIRLQALKLLAYFGDDSQLIEALKRITIRMQRILFTGLYKRRRNQAIEICLNFLAVENDARLIELLPFGSTELVKSLLDKFLEQGSRADWSRLARFQPLLAATELEKQAISAKEFDPKLVSFAGAVLPELVHKYPDLTLSLLKILSRSIPASQLPLAGIIKYQPARVAELILQTEDRLNVNLSKVARKLDTTTLIKFAQTRGNLLGNRVLWFKKLNPEQRLEIYLACGLGWRDSEGILDYNIVASLPGELRVKEGRRHLALSSLTTRPLARLPYTALLPWEEILVEIDRYLRNPEAEIRGAALSALISCGRYQRNRLGELLTFIRARKNEQDPVRLVIMQKLAELPPGIWKIAHLAELGQIIRDTLNAADLSPTTAGAAERLIVGLLPYQPEWSSHWFATLVQERGRLNFYNLGDRITETDVIRIKPALLPVLLSWESREREYNLLSLAISLGRRLKVFDELLDILERVLKNTPTAYIADGALNLIAKYRHYRLNSLVPVLLKEDNSWITRPPVYTYLHQYRQNLLNPYLGQRAYKGKFSTGKTRFVLPIRNGFVRWTAKQQTQFALTLGGVAGDTVRDTPAVLWVMKQLTAMPALPPQKLIELASDRRQAVRDSAVRALGQLDGGGGIDTLLAVMEDDRARIAIYALRKALLEMPEKAALAILATIPLAKVTVAKEVVRLIGELSTEEAYLQLLTFDEQELHRDVQIALLRALWSHLNKAPTWPILEKAAHSSDPPIAIMAGRTTAEKLSEEAEKQLARLIATLLGHPEPEVRVKVLQRCSQVPVRDLEKVLFAPLLSSIGSPYLDEGRAAASAVFATYSENEAEEIGKVASRVLSNRRSLSILRDSLIQALYLKRTRMLAISQAVIASMATDPLTAAIRGELVVLGLPWSEVVVMLQELAANNELHADVLETLLRTIAVIASRRTDLEGLEMIEVELQKSSDERLRRIGLGSLVTLTQTPRGWNEAFRSRLKLYQVDQAALVAAAAQFTFPPEEE